MHILTALHHVTHYRYDRAAQLGTQTIRLRPAPHVRSPIGAYSLQISPKNHFLNWQQDPFGNFLAKVSFPEPIREFKVEVDLIAEVRAFNPFDFFLEDQATDFPFSYDDALREELAPYLEIKNNSEQLRAWVADIDVSKRGTIDFLVSVNQKLNGALRYTVRLEPGIQRCEETLELGSGSCRDMAWLLCQGLRHLGLATRFASGYLIQLAADVKSLDGPSGTETDFTDLHAWTEIYLPGAGWVGLDPTSGLFVGEGHIPLCCTPNPSSAAPISGTLESGVQSTMEHIMDVQRVEESPRVTRPYSETQWAAIDGLGHAVDADLKAQDVRLTMGGEPTFVSLDDRESGAWHFDALGGDKKALGNTLARRLEQRFAPGGLPMHTQGKWYPGEILPRWAMPVFWRRDGEPLWGQRQWLANPDEPLKHDLETARTFIEAFANNLGIPKNYVRPLREDTPYYLWKDRKLPAQDTMMEQDVYEKAERERLQTLMEQNLNRPVGYALPLHYSQRRQQWISNRWEFRSPHTILLTGDSPAGLRLPLGSLPSPKESAEELCPPRSTFEKVTALASHVDLMERVTGGAAGKAEARAKGFEDDPNGLIRTALTVEVRNGIVHLFLPPVAWLEHFVELIVRLEATAARTGVAVVLEGYTPPRDPRISHFSVTPDPGVIEANVQPTGNWSELKTVVNTVYAEAREARLSTEKFLVDGRRVGTGGGNHIVVGAATPEDSPFLRRPDLLRSLLLFWQHHPSLSYVFSGMFVGPTSQAPRIDEARHDSLYELEIAFQQVPRKGDVPPWLVDRLFRNLLIDSAGNTHRSEFCIDKLYSPDGEQGRLGLVELRGFEMPPHPRMGLAQSLLIRACIAAFWKRPYTGSFVRWGTRLHDRFMLPHYLEQDFQEVLTHLGDHGYDFHTSWFEPFFAFRFPLCGKANVTGARAGDASLTLRTALEPWHVMGEESSGGGTSRSVDATVERLQVTATGLVEGRHVLTCNGRPVPLTPTGQTGTQVAGVRFKAWSQPASLHPRIPATGTLVFDVVDAHQHRSLGGCTYHVAHPGGRNHSTYPVNENEAEGRRIARFEAMGHSPGKVSVPEPDANPEFPHTLDLRWNAPLA